MNNNKTLAKVFHYDLYGKREEKYKFLNENTISSVDWTELENREPEFFFVPKDFELSNEYQKCFILKELFLISSIGIVTGKDDELVKYHYEEFNDSNKENISVLHYRPFDFRYTIFDNSILQRARMKVMQHYIEKDNLGLNIPRQSKLKGVESIIDKNIICKHLITGETYNFPLYLYPDSKTEGVFPEQARKPNLNMEIVNQIAKKLALEFVPEKDNKSHESVFAPIDILDYIYAVLHSPTYREKYKEFLKIDFPRVPYPKDQTTFWALVKLGGELRQIHLLESPKVKQFITQYPIDGDNIITRSLTKKSIGFELTDTEKQTGKVWINDTQYFDSVPLTAWEFYIGGYQPAQKWLKDRKKRKLNFEDILHYQKIVVALTETDRIMRVIDGIEVE